MRNVSYAGTTLLVGDEVSRLLLEYAAELGGRAKADIVMVNGLAADGSATEATYVFNAGSNLMSHSVTTLMLEPDNADACRYLSEHLDRLRYPPVAAIDDHVDVQADFDY